MSSREHWEKSGLSCTFEEYLEDALRERTLSNKNLLETVGKLVAENQRLRERIQNVLDGNYPQALKYEKCKHGLYGYDDCAQCVDDYLQAALLEGKR